MRISELGDIPAERATCRRVKPRSCLSSAIRCPNVMEVRYITCHMRSRSVQPELGHAEAHHETLPSGACLHPIPRLRTPGAMLTTNAFIPRPTVASRHGGATNRLSKHAVGAAISELFRSTAIAAADPRRLLKAWSGQTGVRRPSRAETCSCYPTGSWPTSRRDQLCAELAHPAARAACRGTRAGRESRIPRGAGQPLIQRRVPWHKRSRTRAWRCS